MASKNSYSEQENIAFLAKALERVRRYMVFAPNYKDFDTLAGIISSCTFFNILNDEEIFHDILNIVITSFAWNKKVRKDSFAGISRNALQGCEDQNSLILQMKSLLRFLADSNKMSLSYGEDSANQITHVSPEVVENSSLDPEAYEYEPKSFKNSPHNQNMESGAAGLSSESGQHPKGSGARRKNQITHVSLEVVENSSLDPEAYEYEPKSFKNSPHNQNMESGAAGHSSESGQHPKGSGARRKNRITHVSPEEVIKSSLDPEAYEYEPKGFKNSDHNFDRKSGATGNSSENPQHFKGSGARKKKPFVNSCLDPEVPEYEPKSFQNLPYNCYRKSGVSEYSSESVQHPTSDETRRVPIQSTHVSPELVVNSKLDSEVPIYEPQNFQNLPYNSYIQSGAAGYSWESGQHSTADGTRRRTRFQFRTRNWEEPVPSDLTGVKTKKKENQASANKSSDAEGNTSACPTDVQNLYQQSVKVLSRLKLEDEKLFIQAQSSVFPSVETNESVSHSDQTNISVSPFVQAENSVPLFEEMPSSVSLSEQVGSSASSVSKQRCRPKKNRKYPKKR